MGDAEALQEASDGFFLAAEYGRSDVIKALADHGRGQLSLAVVVDATTGRSPLHVAVANGKTDALRMLLAVGFPPDVESFGGDDKAGKRRRRTAYALARELQAEDQVMVFHQFLIQQVAGNDAAGVERMLAAGIDVGVTDGASHSSLLHWAVSCQAGDVLAYLLERSDVKDQMLVNRRNGDGATPLHLAAHGNQAECVCMLLEAGTDTQIRGEAGFSAGKVAAELATSPQVLELFKLHATSGESTGDEQTATKTTHSDKLGGGELSQDQLEAINGDGKLVSAPNSNGKHDGSTCEHAAQVSKLLLQLEEKDLLINQLKKTIEDLVVEAQEIQKLGEERVMLEYVRKLREDKAIAERQLGDANDYIGVQQEQIADLKSQIRRMCDVQQAAPQQPNGHAGTEKSNGLVDHSKDAHSGREEDEEVRAGENPDQSAQSLKLDAWTPRLQRENSVDASNGEPWRSVWNGFWQGTDNSRAAHEEDGEVIMTV